MKKTNKKENDILRLWSDKLKAYSQHSLGSKDDLHEITIKQNDFTTHYIKLANLLEDELERKFIKFDSLPNNIPVNAIIDMSDEPLGEDVLFSDKELFIISSYFQN